VEAAIKAEELPTKTEVDTRIVAAVEDSTEGAEAVNKVKAAVVEEEASRVLVVVEEIKTEN
jgi:hypothetical protein